jgi:DUF4097 and DUF4098 domain-containing protein YvlB
MHTSARMIFLLILTLTVALAAPAAGRQAASRAPRTDETVTVTRDMRVNVDNHTGEVIVRAWDRDAVRVQARHGNRTQVTVRTTQNTVAIRASGSAGPVDYEIHVPVWIPIKIEGAFADISVEGTRSEVAAETVRGDITVKGGATFVSAKSVEGEVTVDGAEGRITASSINQSVTVSAARGDITVDTINGPIKLTKIDAESLEAQTVNGQIAYDGSVAPRGRYHLSTHNGNIVVIVSPSANATFMVRTYNGTLQTNLPLQGSGEAGRGRRGTYTLGNGSAEFELESFGGTIHLRRPGTGPSEATGMGKDRGKEKDEN